MLTRCLAIASPMNFKFSLLLNALPLWIIGLQGVASAQVSPSSEASVTAPTHIQPATSDTSVVRQSNHQLNILGGQSSGGVEPNLVHQFHQFDVGSDNAANFIVAPDVANVISLINSTQPSAIDGLLQITSDDPNLPSNANLFLVNPAGIIFGQDVTLNLPANLTATTSSGLLFNDRYLLSVDGSISEIALSDHQSEHHSGTPSIRNLVGNPNGYLLFTGSTSSEISAPFSTALPTGSIENQGTLQVPPQASITLIGQYIQNDGNLTAPGGNVNLVAASGDNLLRLTQPGNILGLEVIPADTLQTIASTEAQSAITLLPAANLAEMLTGGEDNNATQLAITADGAFVLNNTPPLTPTAGTVLIRGTVDISDSAIPAPNRLPGQVNILGDQINLIGGSIYANAVDQAGTISIGGMPVVDTFSATYVLIDRSSELSVDSSEANGGVINVWASDTVRFYGEATADGASSDLDGDISINAGNSLDVRRPAVSR
ncbi:filamentous hemagglutinin N-terminal domain-containing protein [Leptolyngbyaceae cyanobacterium CCMR0082]|uniref:Filamentous hemagglutinin N-terminal domain-containing protein n=3 Tax=Adonisia TaxID=2950183 RepID=A0A6M0S5C8_9CYAN|nr:filamentous hemagglutinin N-terminal domain-containing protein [Adonisia turfae CCMR0081]NEZ63283.1 filamentous hemagglutinin N-terminal domain-containing protein [Adonisia turfae CCMR0082]